MSSLISTPWMRALRKAMGKLTPVFTSTSSSAKSSIDRRNQLLSRRNLPKRPLLNPASKKLPAEGGTGSRSTLSFSVAVAGELASSRFSIAGVW